MVRPHFPIVSKLTESYRGLSEAEKKWREEQNSRLFAWTAPNCESESSCRGECLFAVMPFSHSNHRFPTSICFAVLFTDNLTLRTEAISCSWTNPAEFDWLGHYALESRQIWKLHLCLYLLVQFGRCRVLFAWCCLYLTSHFSMDLALNEPIDVGNDVHKCMTFCALLFIRISTSRPILMTTWESIKPCCPQKLSLRWAQLALSHCNLVYRLTECPREALLSLVGLLF